jgi:hypothetical protein
MHPSRAVRGLRLAAAMVVALLGGVSPVGAADLAILDVSLARSGTPFEWPEHISLWRVAVGSSELTCEPSASWLQSSDAGRCAKGSAGSTVAGALGIALVDETHVRVRYEGFEDVFDVVDLRIPVQKRLGPYLVTLMRHTWEKVPLSTKANDA